MRSWLTAIEESDECVWVCSVPLLTLFYSIGLLLKPLMLIVVNDHGEWMDGWME